MDGLLNVNRQRIGTTEVENAINAHMGVVESAIVGYPYHIQGQINQLGDTSTQLNPAAMEEILRGLGVGGVRKLKRWKDWPTWLF